MTTQQENTILFWHQKFRAIAQKLGTAPGIQGVIYPPRVTARNKDAARVSMISIEHQNGLCEAFTVAAHPNGLADMTMDLRWTSADKMEFRAYRITTQPLSTPDIIKWLKGRKKQTGFGAHFDAAVDRLVPVVIIPPSPKEQRILDILRGLEKQGIKDIHPPMIVRAATSGITANEIYISLQRLEKKGWVTRETRELDIMGARVDRACYQSVANRPG